MILIIFLQIIFQSGEEQKLEKDTIIVDCARNSTRFQRDNKKVFDGDQINVQFIMLPPPGMSTTIIAGMELKYPNDEAKKNAVCRPIVIPQEDSDYFLSFKVNNDNQKTASKELGFSYMMKRCNPIYHLPFFTKIKLIFWVVRNDAKISGRFDMYAKQIEEENKEKKKLNGLKVEVLEN